MTRAEQWRVMRWVLSRFAPIGTVMGGGLGYLLGGGSAASTITGIAIGALVATGMIFFDVAWAIGLIPRGWREAPFLVVVLTRSFTWLAIITVGIAVPLLTIGGTAWSDLADQTFFLAVMISFIAALVFNFVAQVNRLLGRGVLLGLVLGRYHAPREEVRIFLFVDLRNSTGIAERLGNHRYHAFLKRFVADVSDAAFRHGGEVHRTVGDGLVLTWTEKRGFTDASCVKAVLAMHEALERSAAEYESEFGVAPRTWSGMHVGPVVTGEIGTVKHEIVHLGDTPNTAARIEQACRTFDRPFLVSGDLLEALTLPTDVVAEPLGPIELRGVGSQVELYALEQAETR